MQTHPINNPILSNGNSFFNIKSNFDLEISMVYFINILSTKMLQCNCFQNAPAYFDTIASYMRKRIKILTPWPHAIKLVMSVIYKFTYKARVFVPDKPFQHSLLIVGKTEADLSEEPFRCSTLG
jgi:hypothetical protein